MYFNYISYSIFFKKILFIRRGDARLSPGARVSRGLDVGTIALGTKLS
jgi:hypothetical protein